MSSEVGFIGLGIMGKGMAANLIKSGRTLVVWNRSAAASTALSEEFPGKVKIAETAADVVKQTTLIYSMLSTLEASEAVFPTFIGSVSAGKMIVDCATLTVERMAEMSAEVKKAGGLFLEAPVGGSKGPAAAGQLIFMTAGDEEVSKASSADMEAMGKKTFYFGAEVGKATKMKLVNNMIMAVQCNALAEGIAMTEAIGCNPQDLIDILGLGAMSSPMVNQKGPNMAGKKFEANFPLKHAQKDLRFVLDLGDKHQIGLPVAAASNEQYKKAVKSHGDEDFCAVVEASRANSM